jgi:hypothetical protein
MNRPVGQASQRVDEEPVLEHEGSAKETWHDRLRLARERR